MRDPYNILGVKRDADQAEIKAAWRALAKSAHPDSNPDDPQANARFTEIGRAYDTLKDPKKRALLDRRLAATEPTSGEHTIMQQRQAAREAAARAKAARENAERIMEELARAAAQKAAAEAAKQSGVAEPEEVVERIFGSGARTAGGGFRRTQTGRSAEAEADQPSQASPDSKTESMDASEPTSPIASVLQPLSILTSFVRRFTGTTPPPEKAPDELATAMVTVEELISQARVSVPLHDGREASFSLAPGMTDGHEVRLKGQGYKLPGLTRGDAVVTVRLAPDPDLRVQGFDIHTVLPVTIDNAVLGMQADVKTPGGTVKVDIPAWSGSDKSIRIAGKGLADDSGGHGDLVVELRLLLWEKPDEKITDLMRSMKNGLYL